jgi:hypothetical protein
MPLHKIFCEDPRFLATNDMAATLVAKGHGLIEVRIPSQKAEKIFRYQLPIDLPWIRLIERNHILAR